MALDYASLLYGPVHADLGVSATLTPVDGAAITVTVIDKTGATMSVGDDGVSLRSVEPVCRIRVAELTAAGLARRDVTNAELAFNAKLYRVESTQPMPSPAGEADGELELYLIQTGDDLE